jgi:hypothetical protein
LFGVPDDDKPGLAPSDSRESGSRIFSLSVLAQRSPRSLN